jgi:hypothetical protein
MTAEEYLRKHLSLMINRTKESFVSIEEMKAQPEWDATINAMDEYAEAYHQEKMKESKPICNHKGRTNQISGTVYCIKCDEILK